MKKLKEPHALQAVTEFHDTFNVPILQIPQIPDSDRCTLRINLLEEELKELKEAITKKDIVEAADALADLQYVLSGTIIEFGLASKFKSIFDEVQRSNMSKACENIEDAEATLHHYCVKGENGRRTEKNGKFIIHRISDGKVLKSISYSPAKIKELITSGKKY